MTSDREKIYIAIDLKSFYASAECVARGLDPLRTNLLVADESRTDKTICLAVTPTLKAYGISGRARLFEAKEALSRVCRRTGKRVAYLSPKMDNGFLAERMYAPKKNEIPVLIAPPRMALYLSESARIYSIYLEFIAPEDIHIYSVDEVFMDVTRYMKLYKKTPKELAAEMIKRVYERTGITATAGIGTNMYLAKIAMDIVAKHMAPDEDGVRMAELNERSYRELLWAHEPITDFWRIGRGTAVRLASAGMYTMGDVARRSLYDEESLYRIFGVDAEILIDHAWGLEPAGIPEIKAYRPQSNSISQGQVLSTPYPFEKALIIIKEMSQMLLMELVEKELLTSSVTIHIDYDRENVDNDVYSGDITVDFYGRAVPKPAHGTVSFGRYTDSGSLINEKVAELFMRVVNPDLTVRRLTITANDTVPARKETEVQMDLFTDYDALQREKRLQSAVLSVQKRYGKNALLKGTNLFEGATAKERNAQLGGHKA